MLQLCNPILREKSAAVRDFSELFSLKEDLNDTLMHWRRMTGYGRGIAAPQIGVLKRVVFINVGALASGQSVDHMDESREDHCLGRMPQLSMHILPSVKGQSDLCHLSR